MSLARYVKNQVPVTYQAGTTIFQQGDDGNVMYVIAEGDVQLSSSGSDPITIGAGDAFGEMALIDREPRSATAVAATDVTLYQVSQGLFFILVQDTPYFALEVMKSLSDRLRRANLR